MHLAACTMGAVSLPLNPAYSVAEMEYLLLDSKARVLIAPHDAERSESDIPASRTTPTRVVRIDARRFKEELPGTGMDPAKHTISGQQTALMLYTSGTTGRPKGACMSHRSLTANMDMLHKAWGWTADDTLLHVLPLFHVHGLLVALHGALHAGASVIVHSRFDAAATLRELRRGECTAFMGVPTIYRRLLSSAREEDIDLRHMRLLTSGSDRLPVEAFRQIESRFGLPVVERYGMTETGIMTSNPLHGERVAGSVGFPLEGVELRVAHPESGTPLPTGETGEIQTRGPHVFVGYWQAPDKTAESFSDDGWFRTGDLGVQDQEGRFEIKGRMTDLIISGGFNVYPGEVEQVLAKHPSVEQCAVVGIPSDEWGESVTAYVVGRGEPIDERGLIRHCRKSLANYKVPKRMIFVRGLPRNAMGKIQKARLRLRTD